MKQTSISAWVGIQKNLTTRQAEVLSTLKRTGPSTMHKIAMTLGRPLHSISGRFSELEKKGLIEPCGFDAVPGHHTRTIYELKGERT